MSDTDKSRDSLPPVAVGQTAACSVFSDEDAVVDKPIFSSVRERRSFALRRIGLDPEPFCHCILDDTKCVCLAINEVEAEAETKSSSKTVPPITNEAWNLIADVFPKPHANQNLGWRETLDALIVLTQTGMSWIRLSKHSEAIRARLNRSRTQQWDDIEQRINGAEIDATERERIATLCTFAKRYLAERDARANAAPTPTAAQRLLKD